MRASLLLCLIVVFGCREERVEPEPLEQEPPEEEQFEQEQVLTCEAVKPTPPPPSPGACREGWCWAYPMPQGLSLTAVWATGPDSAWMVGPAGTLVRARGDALELIDTGTQAALKDVWGSSEQDVWAAGEGGTLLHWDGARLQAVPGPTTKNLTLLTGHSANDVWAAGEGGTLLHWDGVAWSAVGPLIATRVVDIASAGPGTVWVTSGSDLVRCTVLSCETISATVQIGATSFALRQLLSFSPDEVLALSHELLLWKNGTWSSLWTSFALQSGIASSLAGSGPDDYWVSAYYPGQFPLRPNQELVHFGTATGAPQPPTTIAGETALPLLGLAAPSPGRLYLVGTAAQVFRLADTQWRSLRISPPLRVAPELDTPRALAVRDIILDVAALPNGEVGVAAQGSLPRWAQLQLFSDRDGNTWVAEASRVPRYFMQGVSLPSDTLTLKVTRVGATGTTVVRTSSKQFACCGQVVGVHGSSERNVWVVSASEVLRWNGRVWRAVLEVAPEEPLGLTGAVWSTSPKAAWIGLTHGLLVWNGTEFERVELPGFKVSALWASSSSDVWAVGARGTSSPAAFHFDGSTWSEVQLPAEAADLGPLVDVVGQCASDVYLVGTQGALLHWDGAQWATVPMPLGVNMRSAAKVGAELWVLGNGPSLMRRPW